MYEGSREFQLLRILDSIWYGQVVVVVSLIKKKLTIINVYWYLFCGFNFQFPHE